ncbi:MAG TPA: plastocyanin/azurin family copper-binding protein [Gammaproteobacteria bacterium]|nr:plastocyanin/azurin family copper-binding protein [Gammaproteobacteria bacterium]
MRSIRILGAMALLGLSSGALAEEHIIKAVITNWVPLVTFAKPGDTLKFMQMAGHDTESIDGMIPEGATKWKAKMGQEGFSVKLEKEGAYIYKCNPHMTTGMVGAVVVGEGEPANLAELDKALNDVKLGKNMVARTIKKMKQELQKAGRLK